MKWNKKGFELENYSYYDFSKYDVYIFGAGNTGKELFITLERFGIFSGFIDNDINKQNNEIFGYNVYSFDSVKTNKNSFIIVAVSEIYENEIFNQLKKENLLFITYNELLRKYLPLFLYYKYNMVSMYVAQICLTERCTLRCSKCAHACFAVEKNSLDMTKEEVYNTVDNFFSYIDYIHEFSLLGGEPLLYSYLCDVIDYIGMKYRNKIGIFSITTNGTILPNDKLLNVSIKNKVLFRISNYSGALPYLKDKYNKWEKILSEENIPHYIGDIEREWYDFGFSDYIRECNNEELISVFDDCNTDCREIRNGKLYYCVMARTASENLNYNIGKNDYLDLRKLPNGNEGKKIIIEFNLGYSDKGYLDMCSRCHGADRVNYPVKAGEQI